MRVVFAGTPEFASRALEAIAAAGHDVPLVLTQPDRPSGRGMRLVASPVAMAAERLGVPVRKPPRLRDPAAVEAVRASCAEVVVVAAYGLILPKAVLQAPTRGCLNIHASLLPRWRGAAPIHRAILAGDALTGICIMQMDQGLDTGPVLLEKAIPIEPRDTTGSLTGKLAALGAEAIVEALARLDSLPPKPQDEARATYASKVEKSEATLDWDLPAQHLERRVRAFNPSPGAEARVGRLTLKVWEAEVVDAGSLGAGVLDSTGVQGLVMGCATGALRFRVVQRPGGRRMSAEEFLRGVPVSTLVESG